MLKLVGKGGFICIFGTFDSRDVICFCFQYGGGGHHGFEGQDHLKTK